ncbi:MAG TPA: VOC family protein [Acidimicrobiales bacterium]|jgi:catechol 2,3-dioxygenase-like lactoylglutathione lyase family enzyme
MEFSLKRIDVINLFAENFGDTKSFYAEVLGLPLVFEDETTAVFKLENIMICLTEASDAVALIDPVAIANSDAGAECTLAMFVDEVDAVCEELARRGVQILNGPTDRPWGVRNACFADPAGHLWQVSQDLG